MNTATMVMVVATTARPISSAASSAAIGRFAHTNVPDDVLDLHNGIIDQDAGDERDRKQTDVHSAKNPEEVHRPEGGKN